MKPIIGIVSNISINDEIKVNSNNVMAIELAGGEPIALITEAEDAIGNSILDMCDGFLFQGGSYSSDFHYKIFEYAKKKNKPVLAICLGFQAMARYFFGAGSVDLISNLNLDSNIRHNLQVDEEIVMHDIVINKDSYMYKIFGEMIKVNSRHDKTVVHVEQPFKISAKTEDGIIEGIEFIDDENYFVGVQFHPEDLVGMFPIFRRFIQIADLRSNKKNIVKGENDEKIIC
jgi:putative glutamine amidotransferase